MKVYVLTQCAAEDNYTPLVFAGEDAKQRAEAELKELYERFVFDGSVVDFSEFDGKKATIDYSDGTYDVLEIFEVDTL